MSQEAGSRRIAKGFWLGAFARASGLTPLALLLLLLPACRIGSGFDTAEKRRNLMWDETPVVEISDTPKQPEELPPEALKAPPIVYLLVAG